MAHINSNTPLSELTVGDLLTLLTQLQSQRMTVRGIAGIAEIFNVSLASAKRIKASGLIDKAITQHGHIIITDVEEARRLYANRHKR